MLCEYTQQHHLPATVINSWRVTGSITSFTGPCDIFSGIEWIWCRKEALIDYMFSKMIEDLDGKQRLGAFNLKQTRNILQVFWGEIITDIGGKMVSRTRVVE